MGIETKSIAILFDEFTTNQIRCWFAQEKNFEVNKRIESGELAADDPEALRLKAEAADLAQKTNARRNQLMIAIDSYFGDPNAQLPKSYGNLQVQEQFIISELTGEKIIAPYYLEKNTREEILISHLNSLIENVLHLTDTSFTRSLAQSAHDYLIAIEKGEA